MTRWPHEPGRRRARDRAGHGRGAPRRRRRSGCRRGGGKGGVPGLARGRAGRPGFAPPPAIRSDRVGGGGPRSARGAERREADLRCARRDRHGCRVLPLLRGGARAAGRPHDSRGGRGRHDIPRADGRRRPDRAVELSAGDQLVEDGACPGGRQHRRSEARRVDAAHRDRARADRSWTPDCPRGS